MEEKVLVFNFLIVKNLLILSIVAWHDYEAKIITFEYNSSLDH